MRRSLIAALLLTSSAVQAAPRLVLGTIGSPDAAGTRAVEVIALNPDAAATMLAWPDRIAANAGTLQHEPGETVRVAIPAGGFAHAHYRLAATGEAMLVVPALGVAGVALPQEQGERLASAAPTPPPTPPSVASAPPPPAPRGGFLPNLSTYQPIYGVYGPGTDTVARLQFSLQYQVFGRAEDQRPILNRLRFGYTQQMFWDLRANSSPFRDVVYMPELFYRQPEIALGGGGAWLSGQIGVRHESNGRSGVNSRGFNTLYVQPLVGLPLGDGYRVELGPRAWAYVGRKTDNPNIGHYRGNAGLHLGIGRDDGLWLAADSRLNPSSGKGAVDAQLSYPLARVISPGLNLYLFAQGFAGYGENLLDYARRESRARIGIGIVR